MGLRQIETAGRRREALAPVGHWSRRRRLAVLAALRRGDVSLSEVMAAHRLSLDEIGAWRRELAARGATEAT